MARRRRHRRKRRDLAPWIVALASIVLLITWWMDRQGHLAAPGKMGLSRVQARIANARIPFVSGGLQPAEPFHFKGSPAARAQAEQCLATAAIYEAGDDIPGEKAVMQVILNRARSPGFPNTICGVVYQGSALSTGCQFSFTCDGSQVRRPEQSGWAQARVAARQALNGHVDRAVGRATHYHADWIVPYWIGSLDKIAQVNEHIFYRRKGHAVATR